MVDRYGDDYGDVEEGDRDARVAYVVGRALSLSDELKTTVLELAEVLRSGDEERGNDNSE